MNFVWRIKVNRYKMNRKYLLIFALLLALFGCAGCGKKDKKDEAQGTAASSDNEDVKEYTCKDIADRLCNEVSYADTLSEVETKVALARIYKLSEDKISEGAFYTNSGATAEDIAVVKAASSDDVSDILNAFEERREAQRFACEDYLQAELYKLQEAVVYNDGLYCIYCVCGDSNSAKKIVEELFSR